MPSFSKNVALFTLSFWLGGVVLFAVVIAPILFNTNILGDSIHSATGIFSESRGSDLNYGVLGGGLSHNMAGAISGAILRRIYLITYLCVGIATVFLLIASLGEAKGAKGPRRALILCFLILGLNALNDRWILDRINKVKLEMANSPDIQALSLRKQFGRWHQISMWVYSGATLCGFVGVLFLLPSVAGGKSKKSTK